MGGGTFDRGAYASFASSTVGKSTDEVYSSRKMDASLNPKGVKIRESRDSADNPESTPLIVALDVTGSMGMIADNIAREGLGTLFTGILDRKPITDPHIMFMGIGDAYHDQSPLQVSQFEADKRIIEQLTKLWLEHGGGGNSNESYSLAWYFAAMHTVHDSMEKRGKRGYLFTVGDEEPSDPLLVDQIKRFIGDENERPMTAKELLELAQRSYNCFHVVILEGNHCSHPTSRQRVKDKWTELMGQHVIFLEDHTKLAETIVAAISVAEGIEAHDAASGWGGAGPSKIVLDAVKAIPKGRGPRLLGGPTP